MPVVSLGIDIAKSSFKSTVLMLPATPSYGGGLVVASCSYSLPGFLRVSSEWKLARAPIIGLGSWLVSATTCD